MAQLEPCTTTQPTDLVVSALADRELDLREPAVEGHEAWHQFAAGTRPCRALSSSVSRKLNLGVWLVTVNVRVLDG